MHTDAIGVPFSFPLGNAARRAGIRVSRAADGSGILARVSCPGIGDAGGRADRSSSNRPARILDRDARRDRRRAIRG